MTRARRSVEAIAVAQQHLEPRHHVVAERHRLRGLQVRETRHDRVGVRRREIEQSRQQLRHQAAQRVDLVAQVQPDVGRDLVVARTAGVQTFADVSNDPDEAGFDVHVDVFARDRPLEFARVDFRVNPPQAIDDHAAFVARQHADVRQHSGVSDGALNVVVV